MITEPYFVIGPSQSFLLGCAFQEFQSSRWYAKYATERKDRWEWAPNIIPHTKTLLHFLCDRLEPFYGSPCDLYTVDLPVAHPPDDGRRIEIADEVKIYSATTPDIIYSEFGQGTRRIITLNFLGRLVRLLRDRLILCPLDAFRFPRDAGEWVSIFVRTTEALNANKLEEIAALNAPAGEDCLPKVEELLIELVRQNECLVPFNAGRKFGKVLAAYYQNELPENELPPHIGGP